MDDSVVTMITTSLERINNKLDKHDDKFDDMSEALRQLIKVDTEIKENREALQRAFKRIEALESTHSDQGCIFFRDLEKRRQDTITKIEADKKDILTRLKTLEDKPKDNIDLIKKGFLGALGVGAYTWVVTHFLK